MSTIPPPLPPHVPTAAAAPRGWWQRHWKWALPIVVVGAFAVVVAFIALILFTLRGSMMGSDVYRDAMVRASAHPELVDALGAPIEAGFMPMGSISKSSEDGGSGRADLVISLSGPRGSGELVATAERRRGAWMYESLIFVPEGGDVGNVIWIAQPDTPVGHQAPAGP